MQQKLKSAASPGATREDVERALADWLDEHGRGRASLSAWESHCFALVLTFLRYGYHDRALAQLAHILEPPTPLPIFPLHHLMSFEALQRALPSGVGMRRRPHEGAPSRDERAGSSGK